LRAVFSDEEISVVTYGSEPIHIAGMHVRRVEVDSAFKVTGDVAVTVGVHRQAAVGTRVQGPVADLLYLAKRIGRKQIAIFKSFSSEPSPTASKRRSFRIGRTLSGSKHE
jgi:hypothetical protein